MSENKVWTLVTTDTEGFVGVSVWASAEAAKQHLAIYAAEIDAEEGGEGGELVTWEQGAIEYGGTENAWTGYLELTDEHFSLVQQRVHADPTTPDPESTVEREAARVESDMRTLAVEEVRARLRVGTRYHFWYNRVVNKPDALHEFDATVRGFDGEYVLVEMSDRAATGRSNERLHARRIARVADPTIAAFDEAIANDTTTTAEWRDRLAGYRGSDR